MEWRVSFGRSRTSMESELDSMNIPRDGRGGFERCPGPLEKIEELGRQGGVGTSVQIVPWMQIQRKTFRSVARRFHPDPRSAALDLMNSTYRREAAWHAS
jgi:hypothetical protein